MDLFVAAAIRLRRRRELATYLNITEDAVQKRVRNLCVAAGAGRQLSDVLQLMSTLGQPTRRYQLMDLTERLEEEAAAFQRARRSAGNWFEPVALPPPE